MSPRARTDDMTRKNDLLLSATARQPFAAPFSFTLITPSECTQRLTILLQQQLSLKSKPPNLEVPDTNRTRSTSMSRPYNPSIHLRFWLLFISVGRMNPAAIHGREQFYRHPSSILNRERRAHTHRDKGACVQQF